MLQRHVSAVNYRPVDRSVPYICKQSQGPICRGGQGVGSPSSFMDSQLCHLADPGGSNPPVGATNVIIVKCSLSRNQSKVCNALSTPRCVSVNLQRQRNCVLLYFNAWNGSKYVGHDSANIIC